MADGIRATVALPDHTGRILAQIDHPNGMKIYKKQVPLGLVAIIYESRPNVTSDAAALCHQERQRLHAPQRQGGLPHGQRPSWPRCKQGIAAAGGDPDIVNIVRGHQPRRAQRSSCRPSGLVDLLIPRGGRGAHPRLCGERHRALHRDRHRHLPRLRGRVC